jgi:hypothetical protein
MATNGVEWGGDSSSLFQPEDSGKFGDEKVNSATITSSIIY